MLEKSPVGYIIDNAITDKIFDHGYYVYDLFIDYLYLRIGKPIRVLEIGVSRTERATGHAFSRMPYVEKYVGIEIEPLETDFGRKGKFINADAYDPATVEMLQADAPFHLLIDDGSHQVEDVLFFFEHYKRLAASVSIMIAEDVSAPVFLNSIYPKDIECFGMKMLVDTPSSNLTIRMNL